MWNSELLMLLVMFIAAVAFVVPKPTTINLAPGLVVPMPTFPSFLMCINDFSDLLVMFNAGVVAISSAPTTINLAPGLVVPTPIFPSLRTNNSVLPTESVTFNEEAVAAELVPLISNLELGLVVPIPTLSWANEGTENRKAVISIVLTSTFLMVSFFNFIIVLVSYISEIKIRVSKLISL